MSRLGEAAHRRLANKVRGTSLAGRRERAHAPQPVLPCPTRGRDRLTDQFLDPDRGIPSTTDRASRPPDLVAVENGLPVGVHHTYPAIAYDEPHGGIPDHEVLVVCRARPDTAVMDRQPPGESSSHDHHLPVPIRIGFAHDWQVDRWLRHGYEVGRVGATSCDHDRQDSATDADRRTGQPSRLARSGHGTVSMSTARRRPVSTGSDSAPRPPADRRPRNAPLLLRHRLRATVGHIGAVALTAGFTEPWEHELSRERILAVARSVEVESSLLGVSPHVLLVARVPKTHVPHVP
jgi:hypothetical protein